MIGPRPIHLEVDGGVTAETAPAPAPRQVPMCWWPAPATFKGGKYKENMDAIRAAALRARAAAA